MLETIKDFDVSDIANALSILSETKRGKMTFISGMASMRSDITATSATVIAGMNTRLDIYVSSKGIDIVLEFGGKRYNSRADSETLVSEVQTLLHRIGITPLMLKTEKVINNGFNSYDAIESCKHLVGKVPCTISYKTLPSSETQGLQNSVYNSDFGSLVTVLAPNNEMSVTSVGSNDATVTDYRGRVLFRHKTANNGDIVIFNADTIKFKVENDFKLM